MSKTATSVVLEFNPDAFRKGSHGWHGRCSTPFCPRPARWMIRVGPIRSGRSKDKTVYQHHARCEVHIERTEV